MPGLEHDVHLSRSAPFHIDGGQLFFYDVINSEIMSRSSVLSCVAEGGGEAKLPSSVTVSDFRMWLTAVTDGDTVFRSRSFVSICAIIKVADAVDDKLIDGWVTIAADELQHVALSSCPGQDKDDMIEGLFLLSDQLQHRLLELAAFRPGDLDRLLTFFPNSLHTMVLAAMTTRHNMLCLPFTDRSCPALEALASLQSSPPSVMELRLHNDTDQEQEQSLEQAVWYGLQQALRHHSGLTSLCLCPLPSTPTFSQSGLLQHIANLTSLRSLDLQGCMAPGFSTRTLRTTLQALPQLHALKLSLAEELNTSTPSKRPRDGDAQELNCLANMLSAATTLTSLHIYVDQQHSQGHRGSFTTAARLHLPQLVQLTAIFDKQVTRCYFVGSDQSCSIDFDMAARFFSNLIAPLTSLTLGQEGMHAPQRLSAAAAPKAGRLIRNLATFTQLRCFSAVLPSDDRGRSVSDALISALPSLIAVLPQPESISISADSAVLQHIVPLLTTTTLTQLHLWGLNVHRLPPDFLQQERFSNLQDLSLHFWPHHQQDIGSDEFFGLAALTSLTQVTALSFRGWSCLNHPADWMALAAMTCLQRLSLGEGNDVLPLPAMCVADLHQLSALTSLTVMTNKARADLVMEHLVQQPRLALVELKLALYEPYGKVDELADFVDTLPSLRRLTLCLRASHICFDEDEMADSDHEHGADLMIRARACLRVAKKCITRVAADAGVELKIESDIDKEDPPLMYQ